MNTEINFEKTICVGQLSGAKSFNELLIELKNYKENKFLTPPPDNPFISPGNEAQQTPGDEGNPFF